MENKTHNVLRIQNIISTPIQDPFFKKMVVKMTAVLELNCRKLQTMPSRMKIESKSHEVSTLKEGVRQVIENFLNGRSEIDHEIFNVESESVGHLGINEVKIELQEPLKSEFENIFNASNWQNSQLKIK